MASNVPISGGKASEFTAPTPQNTPLNNAPLTREALSRPTVGTIGEENEDAVAQDSAAAALQSNPALAGLIQNKLSGLVGRSSGYIESLPVHIKRRVEGLKGVHVEHTKIEADFQKEILELEKKYAERYRPLYQRRAAIVQGQAEPTEAEVKTGEESAKDDDEDEDDEDEEEKAKQSLATAPVPADAEKGIPEFWLTALKNHVALSELITERDEEALRSLIDIRMSYLPGTQAGFKLEFEFDPARNTFFKNKILTKTYFYQDEVGFSGDLVYDHAEGDKVEWLEDKDLTHRIETKKQRNKNTNQTRTVKRSVPVESFFNFFTPPKPPKGGADEEEDEADFEELDERLELDYQIGEDLKDRIIPHSILYFTGEATAYEMDDDDFEDEFDEDDEEDEDEDDEDGQQRPTNMAVSAGSQAEQQECKQQ